MYRLSFQTGPLAGQTREFAQEILFIGEDPSCGCPISGAGLAPKHAVLEENAAGVFAGADNPDAPLLCNGVRVEGSRPLGDGDILEFGSVRAVFHRGAAPLRPARRPRVARGWMQLLAVLASAAFLAFELFLLRFAIVWPSEIYDYETEKLDREEAVAIRERLAEEEARERAARDKAAADAMAFPRPSSASAAASPATAASNAAPAATAADATNAPPKAGATTPARTAAAATATNAVAAKPDATGARGTNAPAAAPAADAPPSPTAEATADALEVLASADFAPASPETELATLPPISAADPRIADAQRVLAQAIAAAQFADFAEAERLFLDLHRAAPGFLPTYGEHAKMLEMQGHWSEALLRWRQLQGLAPANSPYRELALDGIQRVNAHIEDMKLPHSATPPTPEESGIAIGETEIVRLADTPDTEVAEMRVFRTTVELSPRAAAAVPRGTSVRVVLDFFDRTPNDSLFVSPALVSVSPDAISVPSALPAAIPVEATYVIPRGLRQRNATPAEYYGYRLRLYAGERLLAEQAKPKRLLDFTEAP